jgi:hypothetical protein
MQIFLLHANKSEKLFTSNKNEIIIKNVKYIKNTNKLSDITHINRVKNEEKISFKKKIKKRKKQELVAVILLLGIGSVLTYILMDKILEATNLKTEKIKLLENESLELTQKMDENLIQFKNIKIDEINNIENMEIDNITDINELNELNTTLLNINFKLKSEKDSEQNEPRKEKIFLKINLLLENISKKRLEIIDIIEKVKDINKKLLFQLGKIDIQDLENVSENQKKQIYNKFFKLIENFTNDVAYYTQYKDKDIKEYIKMPQIKEEISLKFDNFDTKKNKNIDIFNVLNNKFKDFWDQSIDAKKIKNINEIKNWNNFYTAILEEYKLIKKKLNKKIYNTDQSIKITEKSIEDTISYLNIKRQEYDEIKINLKEINKILLKCNLLNNNKLLNTDSELQAYREKTESIFSYKNQLHKYYEEKQYACEEIKIIMEQIDQRTLNIEKYIQSQQSRITDIKNINKTISGFNTKIREIIDLLNVVDIQPTMNSKDISVLTNLKNYYDKCRNDFNLFLKSISENKKLNYTKVSLINEALERIDNSAIDLEWKFQVILIHKIEILTKQIKQVVETTPKIKDLIDFSLPLYEEHINKFNEYDKWSEEIHNILTQLKDEYINSYFDLSNKRNAILAKKILLNTIESMDVIKLEYFNYNENLKNKANAETKEIKEGLQKTHKDGENIVESLKTQIDNYSYGDNEKRIQQDIQNNIRSFREMYDQIIDFPKYISENNEIKNIIQSISQDKENID